MFLGISYASLACNTNMSEAKQNTLGAEIMLGGSTVVCGFSVCDDSGGLSANCYVVLVTFFLLAMIMDRYLLVMMLIGSLMVVVESADVCSY